MKIQVFIILCQPFLRKLLRKLNLNLGNWIEFDKFNTVMPKLSNLCLELTLFSWFAGDLKAHVCLVTQDLAPRLHNLVRLSEIAEFSLNPDQLDVLAEMNAFNIEGRYPDTLSPPPGKKQALEYIAKSKKVFQWLIDQL